MKSNKIFLTIVTASLLIVGCDKVKDFGNTNVNPNGTNTPSTGALLTNVEAGLGGTAAQTRGGMYAQQVSETQYTDASLYSLPKLDFDGNYAGALYDLQNIINFNMSEDTKKSSEKFGSNYNQIAVARILKAYIFWTITDRWGDIPYSEALKGNDKLTPIYDKQEDIYKDLIKELKEANAQFDNGGGPTGDILYGGDVTKWKRLANSLRMLIALRTSKVYPAPGGWAATEFDLAFKDAAGYINSNANSLVINYPGTVTAFKNPWYNLYDGRTDYAESKLMTDLLASLSDPRQAAFGSSTVGFPYGLPRDQAVFFGDGNSNYARVLAPGKRAANSPLVVISYANVALAIAEAAQRGWITADPVTWYQIGIQASWAQWGVTSDIISYYANANVTLASGNPLQKIALQRYLALYPDGNQVWAEWRRSAYPVLIPTTYATNSGGQIPRRYTYGNNEYTLNTVHVGEAAAKYNNDSQDGKVWWDK